MRLIEVNVLKEWVENWFTKNRLYHPYAKNNNIPITELYDILERLPSAQPEIIRCGKCKHHEGETYCHERDGLWYENDYCSYAERKEQDDG